MRRVTARTSTQLRIRIPDCPSCRRTLTLNHCGVDTAAGLGVDHAAVGVAQLLHVRQCTG